MIPHDLKVQLDHISIHPHDHVAKLVAADWCDDHDMGSTAYFLRWMGHNAKNFLFTGSRCYGISGPDSDWDWVVSMHWRQANEIRANATEVQTVTGDGTYGELSSGQYEGLGDFDVVMRFGPVNVIVVSSDYQMNGWRVGTQHLLNEYRGPDREDAKKRAKSVIRHALMWAYETEHPAGPDAQMNFAEFLAAYA